MTTWTTSTPRWVIATRVLAVCSLCVQFVRAVCVWVSVWFSVCVGGGRVLRQQRGWCRLICAVWGPVLVTGLLSYLSPPRFCHHISPTLC